MPCPYLFLSPFNNFELKHSNEIDENGCETFIQ